MAGIKWEKDFETAIAKAKKEGKPVFHDFWFDGRAGLRHIQRYRGKLGCSLPVAEKDYIWL